MKEAFEKIIERLKKERDIHESAYDVATWIPDKIAYINYARACKEAIEIVNQVAEEFLEKEFSEWCHDCKEYDKEKHHCPRWCKVIRTTLEEIKGNLDVPDINVGDIELLDSLHEKILKSKFAEEVTEAEIDALVKAKNSEQVCEWMQDDGATDIYDTECGNSHMFIDGNPTDNKYEFCPYCGKRIEVVE